MIRIEGEELKADLSYGGTNQQQLWFQKLAWNKLKSVDLNVSNLPFRVITSYMFGLITALLLFLDPSLQS